MIKRKIPIILNITEIMLLFFIQNSQLVFCKANVTIPDMTVNAVKDKYNILIYVETPNIDKRDVSIITPSDF